MTEVDCPLLLFVKQHKVGNNLKLQILVFMFMAICVMCPWRWVHNYRCIDFPLPFLTLGRLKFHFED